MMFRRLRPVRLMVQLFPAILLLAPDSVPPPSAMTGSLSCWSPWWWVPIISANTPKTTLPWSRFWARRGAVPVNGRPVSSP